MRGEVRLDRLLEGVVARAVDGDPGCEVAGVGYDSRQVRPGEAFFAFRGLRVDGHDFVGQAVARGAAAVVAEREVAVPEGVSRVLVDDARMALARAAANWFAHPSRGLRLIGITGTNGKGTTAHLIHALLTAAGRQAGLTGTVHNIVGGTRHPAGHTTPEFVAVQELLAGMVDAGDTCAVMEVSSHALHQKWVDACEFDVAVLTNITQDHLDLHGTMEAYLAAKARLFAAVGRAYAGAPKEGRKAAVLNADDVSSVAMAARVPEGVPILTYGVREGDDPGVRAGRPDFWAHDVRLELGGARFVVEAPSGAVPVRLRLTGRFNVQNCLAALAVAAVEGVDLRLAAEALREVTVPGRFEPVDCGQDFAVVVDYAHTPDGLENVLRAARRVAPGRVIAVFGCGGDRDRGKRPQMGALAADLADRVVITSDNPRSEDPAAIVADILGGIDPARAADRCRVVVDRAEAIRTAVGMASGGDIVVIAGKGHEDYQIFRDRTIHFDDREVARAALQARPAAGGEAARA